MEIKEEINRRRTFAIISHPDAGKTTLTEKFLLYGGAVQEAGSVRARKNQRSSTSDWMEMERKRGISITSTVLQFEYDGYRVNLLDTPGHEDFSEDTYRILTAVDAVIMVIDAAKGIEAQTRKLFEVCRRRKIPTFTFVNKLDRPIIEPLALLDEIENVLKIGTFPINWPLGSSTEFRGIYDRLEKQVHFFEKTTGGAYKAPVAIMDLQDPVVSEKMDEQTHKAALEEIEVLDIAGEQFNRDLIVSGDITPVFFGSAMNNFGVKFLLDSFLKYSVPPGAHISKKGPVSPESDAFSGFVFKITANMDPKHRDTIAFLRVCSGKFTRNLLVNHVRTGKKIRLSSAHSVFGNQRETVEEAFPGDIVGLVGTTGFGIGDTLTTSSNIEYSEIPQFAPEHFRFINNPNSSNYKRFRQGLDQLLQEGVVQAYDLMFYYKDATILGAVGPLQFEVLQYRLKNEYGADSEMETTNWSLMRWVDPERTAESLKPILPVGGALAMDNKERLLILFTSEWSMNNFIDKNPSVKLLDTPFTGIAPGVPG